ncbi:Palmitoyl-protein_thioesterase [Hexamita inflata]|uniref:Palmitoyl-protein thioesterase n=1 Tax=Hexamita inflata TaxID=28002 RepID=A0AA86PHS6_9EUKA|nr:Palmitoyl-protein thioesterase [Hexamita inflata]
MINLIIQSLLTQEQVPIVLIHGLQQNAKDFSNVSMWLSEKFPGRYIKNCEVGNGAESTIIMNINAQIAELSYCINNDPKLASGFVGLGYSNGGLLMRGYLELHNHNKAPMKRLITLSAPLGGFFCGTKSECYGYGEFSEFLAALAVDVMYSKIVQTAFGPANFWRDPYNLDIYLEHCVTLPVLDNLKNYSEQRKSNFMSVDKIVLFGSSKDGAISPWQSAWFGTWAEDDENTLKMEERDVYVQDTFGLKTMNEQGRIIRIDSEMNHFGYYKKEEFIKNVVGPWLVM